MVESLLSRKSQWYSILMEDSEVPSATVGHTCTYIREKEISGENNVLERLYFVGGANFEGFVQKIWFMDLQSFSWSTIEANQFFPRYEHTAFTCTSVPKNIFIFGGADASKTKNDIQVYDILKNQWSSVSETISLEELPAARTLHNGACAGGQLYVFGGGGLGTEPVPDEKVHVYNPEFNQWKHLKVQGVPPAPRLGHVMIALKSKIFVHGGMSGVVVLDELHVFDIVEECWSIPQVHGDIPPPTSGHSGFAHGGSLFIMGGLSNGEATDKVYELCIETMAWKRRPELYLPRPRLDFASCCFKAELSLMFNEDKMSVEPVRSKMAGGDESSNLKSWVVIHGGLDTKGNIFDDCYILALVKSDSGDDDDSSECGVN